MGFVDVGDSGLIPFDTFFRFGGGWPMPHSPCAVVIDSEDMENKRAFISVF